MAPSVPSAEQTATFQDEYIAALQNWDSEAFKRLASPDLHFQRLPKSLNEPPLLGAHYVYGAMGLAKSVLVNPKWTLVDVNVSPGKIWTLSTLQGTLINEKPFYADYVFIAEIGVLENGEVKMTSLTEFADAIAVPPFVTLVKEKMAEAKRS